MQFDFILKDSNSKEQQYNLKEMLTYIEHKQDKSCWHDTEVCMCQYNEHIPAHIPSLDRHCMSVTFWHHQTKIHHSRNSQFNKL